MRDELHQTPIRLRPIDPGDLVVLTVRVVVALLGMTELGASREHGRALGETERRQQRAHHPGARRVHFRPIGLTVDTEVVAILVGVAVAVALAVGLVAFVCVGDEVPQREPVVGDDIIDRVDRFPITLHDIGRTTKPQRQCATRALTTQPPTPQIVAETIVPFTPPGREAAELVAADTEIPGFGDEP